MAIGCGRGREVTDKLGPTLKKNLVHRLHMGTREDYFTPKKFPTRKRKILLH